MKMIVDYYKLESKWQHEKMEDIVSNIPDMTKWIVTNCNIYAYLSSHNYITANIAFDLQKETYIGKMMHCEKYIDIHVLKGLDNILYCYNIINDANKIELVKIIEIINLPD